MEIKTKYEIGQEVFFMHLDVPVRDKIVGIRILYGITFDRSLVEGFSNSAPTVLYFFGINYGKPWAEDCVFGSLKELKESLFAELEK